MNKTIVNYVEAHKLAILGDWMEAMREEADERVLRVVSDQVFNSTSQEFIDLIIMNIKGYKSDYEDRLTDFSEKVVRLNWPLTFVTKGLHTFGKIIFKKMENSGVVTIENQSTLYLAYDEWMTPLNEQIINVYSTTWEKTVSLQKIALQELSAPLIPVFEGITVMPLVGTVDTERAKQIMENLLKGAVKNRSEVVLIDITGVPVVDTMVAHHIIQAAEAVRLIGAKCMICGIRPEIAQTIVSLGIDLSQLTTKNTLQKGIESALELTNRKIVTMGETL
ncbi:RsbT co-antagonist protein RsbRA [Bacillus sp. B15-48]|uniref:RsbT co-antagonist protein RsbRA n=1 Tax=Bacillus sp. B15-48 TaxID=1548601 RepID=UPI00193F2F5F|nr:RsbT co-antagonist protein RsbRA [Bacillus sp. B15-48]MBM4765384.1 STAS domain-containing protein [Bacillus sp. B15-48]